MIVTTKITLSPVGTVERQRFMQIIGRRGGKSRSPAKRAASRRNGAIWWQGSQAMTFIEFGQPPPLSRREKRWQALAQHAAGVQQRQRARGIV